MTSDYDTEKLNEIRNQLLGFISATDKAEPLIRFIVALCTIDAAANYWFGRPSVRCSGIVFKSFVELCLPGYSKFSKQIYNSLRCKLVHSFSLGDDVALVAKNEEAHLKYFNNEQRTFVEDKADKKMPIVMNLESFVKDIQRGIGDLFDDATGQSGQVNAPTIKIDEHDNGFKFFYKDNYSKTVFITKSQYEAFTAIEQSSDEKEKSSRLWELQDVYPELKEKVKMMREFEKVDVIALGQHILRASNQIDLLQIVNFQACKKACVECPTPTPNYDVFQSNNSLTCD